MKKYFLIALLLFAATKCFAQVDTSSVFIKDFPTVVKADSNYIMIVESPYTTFKQTLKNFSRSQKISWLPKTTVIDKEDYIAIQHRRNSHDTTKSIKAKDFIHEIMKDSVANALGNATSEIYQYVDEADSYLISQIGLNATIESVDTAYARITLEAARRTAIDSLLNAQIELKAAIESVDTAYARITLEANRRNWGDSTLTAAIELKVGVYDVYSLLQVLPDSVKISSNNIVFTTLNGVTIRTDTTGKRIVLDASTNQILLYNSTDGVASITPTYGSEGASLSFVSAYTTFIAPKTPGSAGIVLGAGDDDAPSSFIGVTSYSGRTLNLQVQDSSSGDYLGQLFFGDPSDYSSAGINFYKSKIVVSDSLFWGANLVATQSWISSQGYLTSADSVNISDYAWTAGHADEADYLREGYNVYSYNDIIAQIPTVYSWALANTKPSYSWDEVTGKPFSTLSGDFNVSSGDLSINFGGSSFAAWVSAHTVTINYIDSTTYTGTSKQVLVP